jgi:hypothetical protein
MNKIILCLCLLLSGCGDVWVSQKGIDNSEKLCEFNGGVTFLEMTSNYDSPIVYCRNGLSITVTPLTVKK